MKVAKRKRSEETESVDLKQAYKAAKKAHKLQPEDEQLRRVFEKAKKAYKGASVAKESADQNESVPCEQAKLEKKTYFADRSASF